MRILIGLLGMAVVSAGLLASVPANADTAYHRVYRQDVTATDEFSLLDTYQNNALRAAEYNRSNNAANFESADMDDDGFVSRSEFYGMEAGYRRPVTARMDKDLTRITPAAGGYTDGYRGINADIVYRDDPCDTKGNRHDSGCR